MANVDYALEVREMGCAVAVYVSADLHLSVCINQHIFM